MGVQISHKIDKKMLVVSLKFLLESNVFKGNIKITKATKVSTRREEPYYFQT